MPYIIVKQSPRTHQITFEEIIYGRVPVQTFVSGNTTGTRTYYSDYINPDFLQKFDIPSMIDALETFNQSNQELFEKERQSLYETFHIPKKTGGLRRIDAPNADLMTALRDLKMIFETKLFALHHTSAFGYVKGRCAIDSVKKHQQNGSRWFLKIDFSNFFGHTTQEFLLHMLSMIFPFSQIIKYPSGKVELEKAVSLCFLNGGLPQGTPISPMLTNLMMIPIDHRISNTLRDFEGNSYVYTRYADDILISSRKSFDKNVIMAVVSKALTEFQAPFSFKQEKTRYGSSAGSNWNLGVMLNKDNNITIGHKNKVRLRAMVCNYILDRQNKKPWELHDIQVLSGLLSYYRMIEHDYVDRVIDYNNKKFNTDVMQCIKEDLRYGTRNANAALMTA